MLPYKAVTPLIAVAGRQPGGEPPAGQIPEGHGGHAAAAARAAGADPVAQLLPQPLWRGAGQLHPRQGRPGQGAAGQGDARAHSSCPSTHCNDVVKVE